MLYGFVGAHRSGKTTLARKLSEDLGVPFHEVSITRMSLALGYNPVMPMTLEDRMRLQLGLLRDYCATVDALPRPVLVDRSPIDIMAYAIAEFDMVSHLKMDAGSLEASAIFVDMCIDATVTRFDFLYYLEPLQAYVADETKATPAANPAYQRHIALLIQGALKEMEDRISYAMIGPDTLEGRAEWVEGHLTARIDEIVKERASAAWLN